MQDSFDYSETYYKTLTAGWNKESYPVISKLAKPVLEECRPEKILDLGCGSGIYFEIFKKFTKDIYGVDVSEQSVALCQEKGYKLVKLEDAVSLQYPDNYFDFVFSSEVIEHVEDYLLMLKEINRILKPNGVLVLTTTCYSTSIFQFLNLYKGSISQFFKELSIYFIGFFSKKRRDMFVRKWCFESLGGHYHGFKPDALKKDINGIGMTVLKNESFYVYPPVIIYDPKSIYRLAVSGETNYSIIKRIIMLFSSFVSSSNKCNFLL